MSHGDSKRARSPTWPSDVRAAAYSVGLLLTVLNIGASAQGQPADDSLRIFSGVSLPAILTVADFGERVPSATDLVLIGEVLGVAVNDTIQRGIASALGITRIAIEYGPSVAYLRNRYLATGEARFLGISAGRSPGRKRLLRAAAVGSVLDDALKSYASALARILHLDRGSQIVPQLLEVLRADLPGSDGSVAWHFL